MCTMVLSAFVCCCWARKDRWTRRGEEIVLTRVDREEERKKEGEEDQEERGRGDM